jgi:hypothetical protein
MISPLLSYSKVGEELTGSNRTIVPFVACGSLAGFDSDQSYPLVLSSVDALEAEKEWKKFAMSVTQDDTSEDESKKTYKSLDPVQKPINPPYAKFLERKKAMGSSAKEEEKH